MTLDNATILSFGCCFLQFIFFFFFFQLNNFLLEHKKKKSIFFWHTQLSPKTGTVFITKAAFKVYSSLPAIYSFVPSIGSINQKIFDLFLIFKSTVSSEIIGIFGVNSEILFVINSFTLKSPLLTGDLSSFISIFKPSYKV